MEKHKSTKRKQHMDIAWHDIKKSSDDIPAVKATLEEKSSLVGRVGLMMLSCGTGAWRVRDAMNILSRAMGITVVADIGLMDIEYTCMQGSEIHTRVLALPTTGVNTDKLTSMERFITYFDETSLEFSIDQHHKILDHIAEKKGRYNPVAAGLASGLACCGFTFLLGGGPVEMICAFLGAGFGNFFRRLLIDRKITLLANLVLSVTAACMIYMLSLLGIRNIIDTNEGMQAGYICSMLFVIPGFPLITGGIDLAKLDMKSGLERIAYAVLVIATATLAGWVCAVILNIKPGEMNTLEIDHGLLILFRLIAGFAGVYGFSLMFNSPRRVAALAGLVGMTANTLRLELATYYGIEASIAAFIGAVTAGLLATVAKKFTGFPRICLTVPSIVIMVPGLYLYRGMFSLGSGAIGEGAVWMCRALFIIAALPLGLIAARILTDRNFRKVN